MLSHKWLPTDRPLTDQLLELLEWLFATKNKFMSFRRIEILHWMDLYDRRNEIILEAK